MELRQGRYAGSSALLRELTSNQMTSGWQRTRRDTRELGCRKGQEQGCRPKVRVIRPCPLRHGEGEMGEAGQRRNQARNRETPVRFQGLERGLDLDARNKSARNERTF